jgi:hypothetical protein
MRALALTMFVAVSALTGCTDDTTLGQDTAYRRLGDAFTSYDQCIADGNFTPCYQTLTLCTNGRVLMDLENAPQEGSYQLMNEATAVAKFTTRTIVFDLKAATSEQLPGVHAWELVKPIFYGCDVQ